VCDGSIFVSSGRAPGGGFCESSGTVKVDGSHCPFSFIVLKANKKRDTHTTMYPTRLQNHHQPRKFQKLAVINVC
jgi:hypothetical protein